MFHIAHRKVMKKLIAILIVPSFLCVGGITEDGAFLAQTLSWDFTGGNTNVFGWTLPQTLQVSKHDFSGCADVDKWKSMSFGGIMRTSVIAESLLFPCASSCSVFRVADLGAGGHWPPAG